MAKVTMIDPPSGWKYGFPKPIPDDVRGEEQVVAWLIDQGYPANMAENLPYCRYWEEEVE